MRYTIRNVLTAVRIGIGKDAACSAVTFDGTTDVRSHSAATYLQN